MRQTRREFLSISGLTVALSLAGCDRPASQSAVSIPLVFGAAPKLRERKRVGTLKESDPDIVSLRDAIQMMKTGKWSDGKAFQEHDMRRWVTHAAVHGTGVGDRCQHRNWYFAPWHRLYLYYFEEIVRELTKNEDFALPYWNWTVDLQPPAYFFSNESSLNNPSRQGQPKSGRRTALKDSRVSDGHYDPSMSKEEGERAKKQGAELYDGTMSKKAILNLIGKKDHEVFLGGEVDKPSQGSTPGRLENSAHRVIHEWIGGDMANLPSAALDPLFWIHHANVDRLWTMWMAKPMTKIPNNPDWLRQTFSGFCDRGGELIPESGRLPIEKCLNTTDLGYRYDTLPDAPKVEIAAEQERSVVSAMLMVREGKLIASEVKSFRLEATSPFAEKANQINSPLDDHPEQTIRLTIRGITPPREPNIVFHVFLNCPNLTLETKVSDPSYLGTCSFFGDLDHSHGEDGGKVSFPFDITSNLATDYGDKLKAKTNLDVGIVAHRIGKGGGPYEIRKLVPEQVEITTREPKKRK